MLMFNVNNILYQKNIKQRQKISSVEIVINATTAKSIWFSSK